MATKLYVFHPGVGQVRPSDGTSVNVVDGTNVAYMHQVYPPGLDKQPFFQSTIVPLRLLTGAGDFLVIRTVFRNITPAVVGNILARVSYNNFAVPADRDAALTPLVAQVVAMPAFGLEVAATFSVLASTFTPGEELIFAVERQGTLEGGGAFNGNVSLVRVELEFPVGGDEWDQTTDPGPPAQDFLYPVDGASRKVSIGTATNAPSAPVAPDPGAFFRVEQGHIEIQGASSGAWNGAHFVMGTYHFWIDALGRLRMKSGAPAADLDGMIVGQQN